MNDQASAGRPPRLLFVSFPEGGHFTPSASVARAAQRLGAEVSFFSLAGDVSARLLRAGVSARCGFCPRREELTNTMSDGDRARVFSNRVRTQRGWYARWLQYVILDDVPRQVANLDRFISEVSPDLVLTDSLAYAGAIAAGRAKLPWATVGAQLLGASPSEWSCAYREILRTFAPQIGAMFAEVGLTTPRLQEADLVSPWLNALPAVEVLTPRSLTGNDYAHYVGPYLGDPPPHASEFPWHALDPKRPRVYLASGTQFVFLDAFVHACADAAAALGYQLIASGPTIANVLQGRDDVLMVSYAPQVELLGHVDAMISHGGNNSVLEALSRGRPLLISAVGHDQAVAAMMVEHGGVGFWLRDEDVSVQRVGESLRRLVAEGGAAARAANISRAIEGLRGAWRVAELAIEFTRRGEPLMPQVRLPSS